MIDNDIIIQNKQSYNFFIMYHQSLFDTRLNTYDYKILSFFNAVSINKNYSYYSLEKIALYTNISKPTVVQSIKNLIKYNYISKQQQQLKNGFTKNIYILNNIDYSKTLKELLNDIDTVKEINCDTVKEINCDTVKEINCDTVKEINCDTVKEINSNNINNNNINNNNINIKNDFSKSWDIPTTATHKYDWESFCLCYIAWYNKLICGTATELSQCLPKTTIDKKRDWDGSLNTQRLKKAFDNRIKNAGVCILESMEIIFEKQVHPNFYTQNFFEYVVNYLVGNITSKMLDDNAGRDVEGTDEFKFYYFDYCKKE